MGQGYLYSILAISSSHKFNALAYSILPSSRYCPVETAADEETARQRLKEQTYDIVIINSPLVDGDGIKLAIEIATKTSSCVMLLVKKETYDDVTAQVEGYGIAVIPRPLSVPLFSQSLKILCAERQRLLRLERRQQNIRLINTAKWLLIGYMKLTESEAQRYIEKTAMDTRLSKTEVAKNIIKVYQDYH